MFNIKPFLLIIAFSIISLTSVYPKNDIPTLSNFQRYVNSDYGISFDFPDGIVVIDRHNIEKIINTKGIAPEVKNDLEKFDQYFSGILISDITNSDESSIIINELSSKLKADKIDSLDEFLKVEEEKLRKKNLIFKKTNLFIGPQKIPAEEFITYSEQMNESREIYNTCFEKSGKVFNISFILNPRDNTSKKLLYIYSILKNTVTLK